MERFTIGQRMAIVCAALVVLLGASTLTVLISGSRLHDSADRALTVHAKSIEHVGRLQYRLENLRGVVRLMLIDGMRKDRDGVATRAVDIEKGYQEILKAADALREISPLADTDRRCEDVKSRMAAWRAEVEKIIDRSRVLDVDGAAKLIPPATAITTGVQELITAIMAAEDASLVAAEAEVDTTYRIGRLVALVLALLAVGVAVAAGFALRATTRTLKASFTELATGARQVTSASQQVAGSAQSLSQGATEQAASLEETSASMEEMASMTRRNAESSATAAALMLEVEAQVRQSTTALDEMVTSMSAIETSSQRVSKIIKTVDEIAFQTNILALNAAVEAARAGEAGMGFAVVADEVRNLAQRSAQAAKDTTVLIEESIASAHAGSTRVSRISTTIIGITESVTKVKGLVDEVSAASQQQSQGIGQVSQAIAQMEKVTQTTAATAEEGAAASEELSAQAETTMVVIAGLEALVGGVAARRPDGPGSNRAAVRPERVPATVARMPERSVRAQAPRHSADTAPGTGTYGRF